MISLTELSTRRPADIFLGVVDRGLYKTVGIIEDPMEFDPDEAVRLGYPVDFRMVITRKPDGREIHKPIVTNTELGMPTEDVIAPDKITGRRASLAKLYKADQWIGEFYLGAIKALQTHRNDYQSAEISNLACPSERNAHATESRHPNP